jgi:Domain of unknown function (DUF4337)
MDTTPQAPAEQSSKYLNAAVAITVALLATFMGICKVKDDNIVQAMQQAQADKLDHWGYYQARNIRQEIAEATITQLWALFWVALVPTAFGVLMGFAGLTGLPIHPEALVRLLS